MWWQTLLGILAGLLLVYAVLLLLWRYARRHPDTITRPGTPERVASRRLG